MQPGDVGNRKFYEPPALRRPTTSQAALFLVGHAYIGDQGAKEMLELLFPEPASPEPPPRLAPPLARLNKSNASS